MSEKEKITHKQARGSLFEILDYAKENTLLLDETHKFNFDTSEEELHKYIDQQEKAQNRINELLSDCDLLEHKLSKREKLFALNNEYARNNMSDYWLNRLGFERTYRTNKEILEDIEKLEKGLEDENNNDT